MKNKKSLVLLLLFCCFFLSACTAKEKVEEKTQVKSKERYSFYQEKNEKRYEEYKKKKKDLSEKDIILQVNLNLDKPYYTATSPSKDLNKTTILVNKYFYLEESYVPNNLVSLDTTYSKGGIYLVKEAGDAFKKLVDAAKKEGIVVRAISAYRSYAYQVNLYNRYVETDGIDAADTYSARPGFSEHQTGLCVDVDDRKEVFTDFEKTESFQWMKENAHRYGFILRFPNDKEEITGYQYESWHYRYVGKTMATYIKKHNLTLDEYYAEFLMKNKK